MTSQNQPKPWLKDLILHVGDEFFSCWLRE